MSNIEENITSTTFKVDRLHCCMDRLGVSIPDMPDLIAASIFLSEVSLTLFFSRSPSLKMHEQSDRIDGNSRGAIFVEDNEVVSE